MISIRLHKLLFHGRHGLHEGEDKSGNLFEVDAEVRFEPGGTIDSIDQTVNYAGLFLLIQKRMQQPVALLETLAQSMIADIHESDARIRYIKVGITKKNPPIQGFSGEISVSAEMHY